MSHFPIPIDSKCDWIPCEKYKTRERPYFTYQTMLFLVHFLRHLNLISIVRYEPSAARLYTLLCKLSIRAASRLGLPPSVCCFILNEADTLCCQWKLLFYISCYYLFLMDDSFLWQPSLDSYLSVGWIYTFRSREGVERLFHPSIEWLFILIEKCKTRDSPDYTYQTKIHSWY